MPKAPPRHKYALIDLSGTLHVGDKVVPHAIASLKRLRKAKVKLRFLTNTSKTSRSKLFKQLRSIGFDSECIESESEIMTSGIAASQLLNAKNLRALTLVEDALLEDLPPQPSAGSDKSFNSVVVGLAPSSLSYENMNRAFRVLMSDPESELVAIHRAKYYKDTDDQLSLGPGPFVTALEMATGKSAITVGKPSAAFFEAAVEALGCEKDDCVMIGDDIIGDIEGALNFGLAAAVLVRTGKFLKKDENNKDITPTEICDSIVEAVTWIVGEEEEEEEEDGDAIAKEFIKDDEVTPLSPREAKMVKEIQALRHQLREGGQLSPRPDGKELFPPLDEGGGHTQSPQAESKQEAKQEEKEGGGEDEVEAVVGGGGNVNANVNASQKKNAEEEKAIYDDEAKEPARGSSSDKKKKRKKTKGSDFKEADFLALKNRLKAFYTKYSTDKSIDAKLQEKAKKKLAEGFDDLARKKVGKEKELFAALEKAYGPE